MMATLPATSTEIIETTTTTPASQDVTYVLSINESDLLRLYEEREANRPLYVHRLTDIIGFAIVALVSFTSNAALEAILVQSLTPFRVVLLSLTTLHTVDLAYDTAMAIAYMTRVIWDFGLVPCQVNAFFLQTWLVVLPATLLHAGVLVVLNVTSAGASNTAHLQQSKRIRTHVGFVITTWVLGPLTTLLLFNLRWMEVRPYPARMACNLGPLHTGTAVEQPTIRILLTGVCILPVVVLSTIAAKCIHLLWLDRQWKRRIGHFGSDDVKRRRPLSRQDIRSFFVTWFALLAGYLIGAVPYSVHAYVDVAAHELYHNGGSRYEVCRTPHADVFVAWLRLVVSCSHPIFVFAFEDDLRNELRLMMLWWHRPRSPVDETAMITGSRNEKYCKVTKLVDLNFVVPRKGCGDKDDVNYDPLLPVLFLSHQGLCLRRTKHCVSGEDGSRFSCDFRDVVADCCRHETLAAERPQVPHVEHQAPQAQHQLEELQPQQLESQQQHSQGSLSRHSTASIYRQHAANSKTIHTRTTRDRDMKLGIWPQAARISGPRTNDRLQELGSRNQKTRPASRHLIS